MSPPTERSVSATWSSGASAGWQQAKTSASRSSGIVSSGARASRSSAPSSSVLRASVRSRRSRSIARLRAVVTIQPAGFAGRPSHGPALERGGERLLHRVLGEREVAEDADQVGEDAGRLLAVEAADRFRGGGAYASLPE